MFGFSVYVAYPAALGGWYPWTVADSYAQAVEVARRLHGIGRKAEVRISGAVTPEAALRKHLAGEARAGDWQGIPAVWDVPRATP